MQLHIKFETHNGAQRRVPIFTRLSSEHQDEKSLFDQAKCVFDILCKEMSDGSTGSRKGDSDAT